MFCIRLHFTVISFQCAGNGICKCRVCECFPNFTGSACDCSLDTSPCMASNGQICNGRGTCECGTCNCTDPKFQGPTCEMCQTCLGVCAEHKYVPRKPSHSFCVLEFVIFTCAEFLKLGFWYSFILRWNVGTSYHIIPLDRKSCWVRINNYKQNIINAVFCFQVG